MQEQSLSESVKEIILEHRGRGNAIKGKVIASALGMNDDRAVRLVIRDLIALGYPIASATESPAGYFIVETRQEAEDYLTDMRGRLCEAAYRRRDFKKASAFYLEQVTQGRLI